MAETATLKVGDEAPDFELPAHPTSGETFRLSDHRGASVVLNFVPAAFSPVCSNQLPIIEETLAGGDAVTAVISTDNTWTLQAWREQAGVSYPVLSDFNPIGETAGKYGVLLEGMNMANRVVVVVGADGRVAYIEAAPAVIELPDYGPRGGLPRRLRRAPWRLERARPQGVA